jgi:hypothetical protein
MRSKYFLKGFEPFLNPLINSDYSLWTIFTEILFFFAIFRLSDKPVWILT